MADVKFSELTSLAAADVASDDILAIVDTGASTSKKLSIDNLFGAVPVNIAQTDATDATSSAGAVRTAGGVSMAKKLYVGTTSTLVGAVTATAGVFPATQDGAALGSTSLQFSDLFLADSAVIGFGDDNDTTLTHTDGAGLTLNGTNKLMFGDTGTYIHQSADGVLDLVSDTELELNATTIDVNGTLDLAGATISNALLPNASGTIDLGSTSAEFNDAFFSTGSVLNFGDGQEVSITAATTGLTINADKELHFRDAAIYINSSTNGQLDAVADAEIEITAPIVDIDASTGIALDGANLNSAWTVNTTNKIQFHDTGNFIHAPANGQLLLSGDGIVDITGATDITLNTGLVQFAKAGADVVLKHETDAYDMAFQQTDGSQVALITDGAKAPTSGFAAVQTAKGGFSFKQRVITYTLADTSESVLTLEDSGSMIELIGNASGPSGYADLITLPIITAADAGWWCEFFVTTVFHSSDSLKIRLNTHSGSEDSFHLVLQNNNAVTTTAWSAGKDILTLAASTPVGTYLKLTAIQGGAAEKWLAQGAQPSGTSMAIASS